MERFAILFEKHLRGELTTDERLEFAGLLLEPSLQQQLMELTSKVEAEEGMGLSEERKQELFAAVVPVRRMWKRWMVAASIIIVLFTAGYIMINRKQAVQKDTIARTDVQAPASNKARITLASGQQVNLDDAVTGLLHIESGVQMRKLKDGQVIYVGEADEVVYNTLENPRGSKVIDLTLGDGTQVWLNAESSITYPVSFAGNERRVTMTGEAYFEVAKNGKPFTVMHGVDRVDVLGTHFNINAYHQFIVTLLEGSVNVNKQRLVPGQQYAGGEIKTVDTEEVIAWKEGLFDFRRKTLDVIMKELAPWYDIEVVYTRAPGNKTFSATLSRESNLSEVLKIMESAGIHFSITNKMVRVTP